MIETQALLTKIAALKQRLEQAQGLVTDASSVAASLVPQGGDGTDTANRLRHEVARGFRHNALLESTLRQLPASEPASPEEMKLPTQLTARASRLLWRGQELLVQLRTLADEALLQTDQPAPLPSLYREATILTDLTLRTIQSFPESPSAQLRLCEGLEVVLNQAANHLALVQETIGRRRGEEHQLEELAGLLTALAAGDLRELKPLEALAEALLVGAQEAQPLRFLWADPGQPARFAAAHSLTVAQVAARLARQDPDWRGRLLEPILAALVHDAGMLTVPVEILTKTGPLDDDQRRRVEAHARDGAEMVARLGDGGAALAEATACHHERLDGTGYPGGLRDAQLGPLVRLLSVCDVYVALCSPRPHRPAHETRTALTDTLLCAEQGALDRQHAERLLSLSFFPVGSVVELADGAVGVVVATHQGRRELNAPARPVLALVTDAQGQLLPLPHHVDLAECEGRSIVRGLTARERQELLGKRYPLWV
jgi:HD-GYP domain-containing protein (c-di-GMP phosphodiesterase class II)